MSDKNTILENSDNKLLDNHKDSKHINENLNITKKTEKHTSEKNFITKNGKKYYKTNKPYIYKCEENYFGLYNKCWGNQVEPTEKNKKK